MKRVRAGGGWAAIRYSLVQARRAGGLVAMWRALRSKNACKTCALGMGGQQGGMVNELGRFPEVCKKSIQAMAADMQPPIEDSFWSQHGIEQLRRWSPRQLEEAGRLVTPLIRESGATHYRPASWDEAIDRIADQLQAVRPDETFWYFSGRSSNEAGFLLQLFARLYGTNNVNNCSYYCHQASGVGLTSSIGTGTATLTLDDLEHADLVFLIGGNPASNHPRLITSLKHVRDRGGDVIVVNPVVERGLVRFRIPSQPWSLLRGSRIASHYIQPHIGGDLALLTGLAKRIDELNAQDTSFLREHCSGYQPWIENLRVTSWHDVCRLSGVAKDDIDRIAQRYADSKNAVFSWTMGITHHAHGVQNVQAITNLALMRGMVGRPHAGLMPIRGHSNVQGIGSVGAVPRLKDHVLQRLQQRYDLQISDSAGLDTLSCMEAAHAGTIRFGFCLGGNLYGSNPDAQFAAAALSRLEMLVYLNTTLNTGHVHGVADKTIILPVLPRDEEPQPTTQESMFNFVRLSDGGPRRYAGPRSEVSVIARLAERVVGRRGAIDWQQLRQTSAIRRMIAEVVPGWSAVGTIDQTREEFTIDGRILHRPRFATADGRARLHVHRLDPEERSDGRLRLMTVRSEGQFNTVVYEEEDLYRGQERRDVVLVHPEDLQRFGLSHDQQVRVRSDVGSLERVRVRAFPEIRAGNALMYYPEANVLVPRRVDPRSRTPAFKGIPIVIEALD